MSLLSIDSNAKTVKGQKYGYMTGILYMAPHTISGVMNVCSNAKLAGCDKACLYSAGRGKFNSVQQGRLRKTIYFFERQQQFMNELVQDIARLLTKAKKADATPLVRLNGTSDIIWERKKFTLTADTVAWVKRYHGIDLTAGEYNNIMDVYTDVQFYDYTKIPGRFNEKLPKNYDLTFSYSGVATYQKQVDLAMKKGMRIAVVFRKRDQIPTDFLGMQCIDGDNTDIRHIEPQGVVVALYAKGSAVYDNSGFVQG